MSQSSSFGHINPGILTTDDNQIKVHLKYLAPIDIANLKNILRETLSDLPKRRFKYGGQHIKDKIKNSEISQEDEIIQLTIDEFLSNKPNSHKLLVEYNEKIDAAGLLDRRILLRSTIDKMVEIKNKGNMKCHYCFSINIDRGEVVTTYWNAVRDTHHSLDPSIYSKPHAAQGLKIRHNILKYGLTII